MALDQAVGESGRSVNRGILWIQRFLALSHFGGGLTLLLGAVWFVAALLGVRQPGTAGFWLVLLNLGFSFLGPLFIMPQAALGLWMLVLALWLWAGQRRLRLALLATHGFVLLLGLLFIGIGFRAVAAAERSTAHGGGLLSPIAGLPFLQGVPLTTLALCSIAFAVAVTDHNRRRDKGGTFKIQISY